MSETIIKLENISKQYRLGQVGTQTLRGDFQRWWHRVRGKEDPTLKIGTSNKLDTVEGEYVWALRDINLEVKQGEVLGIIGKNGAGKSTLLKLLSRVTGPTTGQIKVKGRIASLLEVGTGFHPDLTGRENIFLNGAILGMTKPEIRSKFDEIVDFAGVAKYIDTPVKRYSSGMYVRLAFAVAAHLEPDILVVDEVLAVGDAEFQKKAIGKMQDISTGAGRTVLFVSHNMPTIQNLCNNAIVLESGEIVFNNSAEDAITFYLKKTKEVITENLLNIQNRSGNGYVKFSSFYIEDINGNKIQDILTGSVAVFCFTIKTFSDSFLKVDVGFSIHSSNEISLAVLYSSYQNHSIEINKPGEYTIRCKIPEFPFSEGVYSIGGRILCNGIESDWPKEKIGEINVIKGDFYRTGNLGIQGNSIFLIKGQWESQ